MNLSLLVSFVAITGVGSSTVPGAAPAAGSGAAGGGGGPGSSNVVVRSASGGAVGGGPSQRRPMNRPARPAFGGGAVSGGGGGGYASGAGRGSPMQLLRYKEVQNDLQVSKSQAEEIGKILSQFRNDEKAAFESTARGPQRVSELRQSVGAALNRATNQIGSTLSPEQNRRLSQIGLQQRGARALFDPEVSSALDLTDSQRRTLFAMNSNVDYQIMIRTVRHIPRNAPDQRQYSRSTYAKSSTGGGSALGGGGGGAGSSPQDPALEARNNAEIAKLIRDSEAKMLHGVLTPAQQKKLEQMKGVPCKLGSGYVLSRSASGGGYSKGGSGR